MKTGDGGEARLPPTEEAAVVGVVTSATGMRVLLGVGATGMSTAETLAAVAEVVVAVVVLEGVGEGGARTGTTALQPPLEPPWQT